MPACRWTIRTVGKRLLFGAGAPWNTASTLGPSRAFFIMARLDEILQSHGDSDWQDGQPGAITHAVESSLETGHVLVFPQLRFGLSQAEQRLLDTRCADPATKNISLRGPQALMRGAVGSAEELVELRAMLIRFRDQATALAQRLFPHYIGKLQVANTSYRPVSVEGRETSWRKDDTRLHVDAFPSNPTQGARLLRIFTNVHPGTQPRIWRVGEDFQDFARTFLPRLKRPLPGSAWLLERLHITKQRRTEFDHLMLGLHDGAKADMTWQRNCPQREVAFAPGTTWVMFSDQVLHAVMSGQFMMEQTFWLSPTDQLRPDTSPLCVLERMTGRRLGLT